MSLFQKIAPFVLIVLLSACSPATMVKMQPSKELPEVADVTKKVTILLTTHIKNENSPEYQLRVMYLESDRANGEGRREKVWHMQETANIVVGEADSSANLRLVMDPGPQTLRTISAWAKSRSLLSAAIHGGAGSFILPLHMDINLDKPGVYYVGRIEATVRPRSEGEFTAGPALPVFPQLASGATGGSFDIAVKDNYEADVAALREKFSSLRDVEIQKAILPEWNRRKAQEWWEKN